MLCFCLLRIRCSAGFHRTPFICLVIYGILLVPWHVVNLSLSSLLYNWKTAVDALKEFFDGQTDQKLCIIISLIETFGLIEMVR